jgi:hypothetical protein
VRCLVIVLIVAGFALQPALAAAQASAPPEPEAVASRTTSARAYRGLFGPTEEDELRPPALTLNLSVAAGVDDNTRFATGGVGDATLQGGRQHQGVQAVLAFVRRRPHSTVALDLSSAVRYYPSLRNIGTQKHSGAVSMELVPSRQVRLQFAQSASYSPSYQLALAGPQLADDAAGDLPAAGIDYSVARNKQMTYGSSAAATYAASAATELSFGYTGRYTNFFSTPDFHAQRAGGRFTRRLAAGVDLRLGYGFGTAGLSGRRATQHHDLDIGVNYGRQFLFSPRTSLGFTSGSTVILTPGGRQFPIIGSVQLRRRLAARWMGDISYTRGLQSIDTMAEPFLAGAVSGSVSGYLNSRTRLRITPSYAQGADVTDSARAYRSWTAETRADIALSHHWAIYAEHFYYHYQFAGAFELPGGLQAGLNRQGLRIGLALWAPVIR